MDERRPGYDQLLTENAALREENRILRLKLGIADPEPQPEEMENALKVGNQSTSYLTMDSPPQERINFFLTLFRGRSDVYATRYYNKKMQKHAFAPVCSHKWNELYCKDSNYNCHTCNNHSLSPLNRVVIARHFMGKSFSGDDIVGMYPLTPDNCCYFLAISFDETNWKNDVSTFRGTCANLGLAASVERTGPGNGAHVWFFFEDKIPAATARKFGSALLTTAMSQNHRISFRSYDRLHPNQDTMPDGGMGIMIALPLQGAASQNGNSLFIDESFNTYPDQWVYLSNVTRLSLGAVEGYIRQLCGDSELGILYSADDDGDGRKSRVALSPFDFSSPVQIVKSNMLHVNKAGISHSALNQIKRLGAFRNPEFYKAQAMRHSTHDKPRIIDLSRETDKYLSIPRGLEDRLLRLLQTADAPVVIQDERNHGTPLDVTFNGTLKPGQLLAAQALLQHDNGILAAEPGFGKTVIGAYIISQKKVNTLIIVQTGTLFDQWKERLEQFISISGYQPPEPETRSKKKEASMVGQLGAGKKTLNGHIDIAIVKSLDNGDEVKEFVKDYGLVIIDECHHVAAPSFERVLNAVNAATVYGLTATPTRKDGKHPIILMQCGAIRHSVNARKQAGKSEIRRFVSPRFTSLKKPTGMPDSEFSINRIYAAIAEDPLRNKMIVDDVIEALQMGRNPIILTQRRDHVELLAGLLEQSGVKVVCLTGSASAVEKRGAMEQLQAMGKDSPFVLVATGRYVGEGFDEPRLDTLFLAAPISWKGILMQYTGRLHRPYEGKEDVIVYDYVDSHIQMMEHMYYRRVSGYRNLGYRTLGLGVAEEKVDVIFDGSDYWEDYERDILSSRREIVISSPLLLHAKTMQMLNVLNSAQLNGARITVMTCSVDNYDLREQSEIASLVSSLTDEGIHVIAQSECHQKFTVIDRNIVWYGSINMMGPIARDGTVMRLESLDIASELLMSLNE